MQLSDLKQWLDPQKAAIEDALRSLVEINTFTANKPGVAHGMDELSRIAERYKLTVETIQGRHRLVKAGNNSRRKPRIMLITHMDTVFPPDSKFQKYENLGDGFVTGPGVGDIKGGTLVGMWAMLALRELLDDFDVQMIVSADEEKGSPSLRDWYTGGHIGADYAIGLEPGFPQGDLTPTVALGVVYQRRGYGAIQYTIKGKRTHSGTAHLGLNAIEAAAQKITRFHALGNFDEGTSVTVGMIEGGTAANTVPDEVTGTVSWRFERLADGERLKEEVEAILNESYVYNAELDLHDSVEYRLDAFLPPMERSAENQKLIDYVLEESQRLGQNVVAIARGGGSDANFVSRSGTPSICGMGVPIEGIHTEQEKIYLPGLYDRIELLASTLYRIITEHE